MRKLHDFSQIIGLLENGKLNPELSTRTAETLDALHELSEAIDGGKVKGSLTLKLEFTVKDGQVEIQTAFDNKIPKRPRRVSTFWIVEDGALSMEHPRQHDMFGVRPVSSTEGERAPSTAS
ncbi:hypothetical protein [Rhizobium sp. Leaf386]|uniref:hypothetical protein n=1 Tax=Rhizobium sp. Leaf386 TaxID=1736359 RepID=UPI0007137345|nr:hypothetical protein [Rhizobium sp. Leaf386]KQS90325.1 hypothetical protein ASG50_07675 [Rhizobium sp. Leaf386]